MSLKDDLARNRAVFEKLVGGMAYEEPDGEYDFRSGRRLYENISGSPNAGNTVYPAFVESEKLEKPVLIENQKPEKIESYSLSRGTVRRNSMSLAPPAAVEAPPLGEPVKTAAADPLETLYYQLEVEARRSSQLLGEGDFFE